MNDDQKWMKLAIKQSIKAEKKGEIPVGAIIVKDGILISSSHNESIMGHDPTAHAEIQVIRLAGKKLKNYRLTGSTLYVTLEPCAMCLGAIMHARIGKVIYGAYDIKSGVCGSNQNLTSASFFNHKIKVSGGILEGECKLILSSFFYARRRIDKLTN